MKEIDYDRQMPASLDTERSILGAICLDNQIVWEAAETLKTTDFALDSHMRIYAAMLRLAEAGIPIDILTLMQELGERKEVDMVGGAAYLAELTEGLPRRLSIAEYVKIVKDKAQLRGVIRECAIAVSRARDQQDAASEVIGDLQDRLLEEQAESESAAVKIGQVAPEVEAQVKAAQAISSEDRLAVELTWGVKGLDEITKGAFGGELTIIAAESGGSKTSFAVQMVVANAREGTPCAVFSIEMQKEKFVRRFYCNMGKIVTSEHMRDPRLMNLHTHIPEMARLTREMAALPVYIDDSPVGIKALCARIRTMRRRFGIRLAVIDYLQLVEPPSSGKSDSADMRRVIFPLRDLVKVEPSIHLLVLSQYSKADGFVKKRRRSKADLYGGSVIHHAAQNVILISVEDAKEKERNALLDVEFLIDKQRDGRTGKATCMFDRDHLSFVYPQPML